MHRDISPENLMSTLVLGGADVGVIKGGRLIFRVGDNPAEAFARVIGDAFGH